MIAAEEAKWGHVLIPSGTLPAYDLGELALLPGTGAISWHAVGDPAYDDWGWDALPLSDGAAAVLDPGNEIVDELDLLMPGQSGADDLGSGYDARAWLITVGDSNPGPHLESLPQDGGGCSAGTNSIALDGGMYLTFSVPACEYSSVPVRWRLPTPLPIAGWRSVDAALADWARPLDEPLTSTVDGLGAGWVPAAGWCVYEVPGADETG